MKRKVNRVGIRTLTISLPSKWAKENNIKQGDELEITEGEDTLIINTKSQLALKRITIDTEGLSSAILLRKIYVAYMLGYEEIEVLIDDTEMEHTSSKYPSPLQNFPKKITAHEVISSINQTGIEIVEQNKNRYLLSILVSSNEEEFEKTLKRLFVLTKVYGDEILQFMQNGFKDSLNSLYSQEITINKFYRLCVRIINSSTFGIKKTCLYHIVCCIEEIGDTLWNTVRISRPKKIKKEELLRFKEFNEILTMLHVEFFKDTEDKLPLFYHSVKKLKKGILESAGEISFLDSQILNLCEILNQILQCKFQLIMIKNNNNVH